MTKKELSSSITLLVIFVMFLISYYLVIRDTNFLLRTWIEDTFPFLRIDKGSLNLRSF